jgi:hypothetical protein
LNGAGGRRSYRFDGFNSPEAVDVVLFPSLFVVVIYLVSHRTPLA